MAHLESTSLLVLEFLSAYRSARMSTEKQERTLASRLGQTAHASPLRFKIRRLMKLYPTSGMTTLEDWLLDIANHRGVKSV